MLRVSSSLVVLFTAASLAACGAPDPKPQATATAAPAPVPTTLQRSGPLAPQAIETAVWAAPTATATPAAQTTTGTAPASGTAAASPPRPDMIRAQILLDRARFSPGAIDGLGGDNTRQAISAFEQANSLPVDGELDAQVFARLTQGASPVTAEYVITAEDVAGPFAPVPEGLAAQARATTLGYASATEALAEKFHVTEALLTALNPGVDVSKAGTRIVVPAVLNQPALPAVARIEVTKAERSLRAFDAAGSLIAFYPATIGSTARPAPSGDLTILGVAREPTYTYDPSRVSYDRGDKKLIVPAGPNNPVGSVWIELSRDTYGIHGTPEPSQIAKTASSGCVRLTNWSAEQLAAAVKPGVAVKFV